MYIYIYINSKPLFFSRKEIDKFDTFEFGEKKKKTLNQCGIRGILRFNTTMRRTRSDFPRNGNRFDLKTKRAWLRMGSDGALIAVQRNRVR